MSVREQVLTAALDCFTEFGFDRTSVTLIRERSGVSNGALFHHFPTKEAIADALYLQAMDSVQGDYLGALKANPTTLRDAVAGIVRHQLAWVEQNPQWAKFLYGREHLDWSSDAGSELRTRNDDLGTAYRKFLAPFVASGAVRELPMATVVAIVTGPGHAIARRWLAEQLRGPLVSYADDLIDAAVAGLSGKPTRGRRVARATPNRARIRLQLIDDGGAVLYTSEHDAQLDSSG